MHQTWKVFQFSLSFFVCFLCVCPGQQWMTPHNQFGQIGNVGRMLLHHHPKTSPLHILDARAIWEWDENKTSQWSPFPHTAAVLLEYGLLFLSTLFHHIFTTWLQYFCNDDITMHDWWASIKTHTSVCLRRVPCDRNPSVFLHNLLLTNNWKHCNVADIAKIGVNVFKTKMLSDPNPSV